MQFRNVAIAAAIAALPSIARAQPIAGLYIGTGAGMNIMQNETVQSVNGVATPGRNIQLNIGATALASIGWGFGNGLRGEFEFDYRYNSLNRLSGPNGSGSLGGSEQKYGPMANLLYDFNGLTPLFVPYIGLGAGYQWANDQLVSGSIKPASGAAGAFAYQAIIGAAIPVSAMPGLAATVEYRFMGLAGNRSYTSDGFTSVRTNDFNHSVLIGLRYEFGAAPAPMEAAPMPAAEIGAKTFLVFFDWDKSALTARSEGIVRDAAGYSTSHQYTRIDVGGNTDTSGTPAYNQGLSERRAHAVAAELVRDGVPQNAIAMHAYGDTHLLVPTGPGVREPQNRRVEIVFH